MSEFDKARLRAEKRMANQAVQMGRIFQKPETSKKKNQDKIVVILSIDGNDYEFIYKAKISGNILASQLTEANLKGRVQRALLSQFTGVE